MKRIIPGVAAMLMTFALGVGVYGLVWTRSETSTATVEPVVQDFKLLVESVVPVITPVAEIPNTPESRIILDYNDVTFYPNGGYSFLGTTPKEFAEVDSFLLEYSDIVDDQPVGAISVVTKNGDDFENNVAMFGTVNEGRLTFITAPNSRTGFEYFLDGEFIRKDFDKVNGLKKAVLRGTLMKLRYGKKIAERVVNFRIEQYGC